MGVNDLQMFLESPSLEGGAVSVDLLKIAKNVTQRQQPHNTNRKIRPIGNKLKLIIDAENCLDRLYGGYFSDWACGGQWNRVIQFLSLLTRAIERGNIELAVVFNGTIESCRMNEWIAEQANIRQKVGMVLKHINTKATPPPKVWWTAPTCLRSALRMALRHLGVTVMCTMDDHHQEVIAYCREYGFHGLLADDAEYAAFDPPRYFSSENIKLTYKGSLETKEFMVSELTKTLQITQEQLCVMAALMGNFLLTDNDLSDFHKRIGISNVARDNTSPAEANVKTMAEFVRTLPPVSNMEALVAAVLGSADDKRASKLRQSVQYYLNGTASGFLKYCAPPNNPKDLKKNNNHIKHNNDNARKIIETTTKSTSETDLEVPPVAGGFASETTEQEEETLQKYKLATVNSVMSADYGIDQNGQLLNTPNDSTQFNGLLNGGSNSTTSSTQSQGSASSGSAQTGNNQVNNILVSSSSSNTSSVPSSPKHSNVNTPNGPSNQVTPTVSADVLRTASLRHQKGLMTSTILHVLSTQDVRLPCLMEDEGNREFPPIHDIYQALRQRVYAVLFNLHHLRYVHAKKKSAGELSENAPQPDIIVREWIYSRSNPFQSPIEVKAEPLPWAVPTLQRLWFGPALDDKRRRMRALLSCLNSDTPLILNTGYVPQHMLIMACVLRYIMSQDKQIMRRHELDAFLCHAVNVDLMNPQYLQELTLNVVTSRGVQLAALFMQGVEMALLANDACGAPLPWLMCCPWLYFDGKLFHHTLNRSAHCKNILEVCENHIERVVKVERMRKAILEGLDVKFAKMPMPPFAGLIRPGGLQVSSGQNHASPSGLTMSANRLPPVATIDAGGNGMRPRPISSRGGQLQVAGVVVGSWGANYGYQQNMRHGGGGGGGPPPPQQLGPNHHQNHMMGGGGMGGVPPYLAGRGRGMIGAGASHFNPNLGRGRAGGNNGGGGQSRKPGQSYNNYALKQKNNNVHKKRNNTNNKTNNKGPEYQHILTVRAERGDIPADEYLRNGVSVVRSVSVGGGGEGGTKTDDSLTNEHKGQGDAPNITTSD